MRRRIMYFAVATAMITALVGPVLPAAAGEPCTPTVAIGNAANVNEGNALKFTVTLELPRGCDLAGSVQYTTMDIAPGGGFDATPGSDYVRQAGLLQWSLDLPGATRTVTIPALLDGNGGEPNEEVVVRLFAPTGVVIADSSAAGTIASTPICIVEPMPCLCTFTVELPEPARAEVSLSYSTIDGTAKAGQDFIGIQEGRVTIPVGARRAEFSVEILPDPRPEPDEWFTIRLTATSAQATESDRLMVTIRP